MNSVVRIVLVLLGSILFFSCQKKTRPNYQFFPNMYESVGYDTYSESKAFQNGMEAQIPAVGTIKRGWTPFDIPNTEAGKAFAKDSLFNPLPKTDSNMAEGQELYNIYCSICHGKKGKADGTLMKREKFLGVPNYADRDITEGSIYHTIYYGLNAMGSHAAQINEEERWKVTMYVDKLKKDLTK